MSGSKPAKHFSPDEFTCTCGCGLNNVAPGLVEMLDKMRELANMPLRIASGTRCQSRNIIVGGKADSAHLYGLAVDIGISDSNERWHVVEAAIAAGFTRVGIGSNLVHVDIDESKPQHVLWVYR